MLNRISNRQWMLLFLVVGLLTHFAWPLSEPRFPIFDEYPYGTEVIVYLGEPKIIFDIHPPHAKMVTALAVKALGFDSHLTMPKPSQGETDFPLWKFRFLPAVCGILIPILFFFLARLLGANGLAAPLACLGLCLDNALVVHTRLLTIDGQLLVYALGAFIAYELSRQRQSVGWVVLAGGLSGLAFGTKFTGLAVGGFLCLVYLLRDRSWKRALIAFGCGAGVYLAGWWLSFRLLGVPGDFFDQLVSFHGEMLAFNGKQGPWHNSSSPWWSWPLGGGGIWLLFRESWHPNLFLCEIVNPIFWPAVFVIFVRALRETDRRSYPWVGAYLISFVPFIFIGRYMFVYHYFLPLLLSLLVGVMWLDRRLTAKRFWDAALVMALLFFLVSPLTYSFPVPYDVRLALIDHLPHFW